MAKKFRDLVARMSPEAQARATARAQGMLLEMQLQELRKTKNITQIELAQVMQVEQAAISKTEHFAPVHQSARRRTETGSIVPRG
jgi:DNA-binding transcriptional regulator YiaG